MGMNPGEFWDSCLGDIVEKQMYNVDYLMSFDVMAAKISQTIIHATGINAGDKNFKAPDVDAFRYYIKPEASPKALIITQLEMFKEGVRDNPDFYKNMDVVGYIKQMEAIIKELE